jgi:hypothetical protein
MVIVGLVAMALGTAALSLISTLHGAGGYVGPLVILTAGFATFQAANNTAVLASADPRRRGVVSGLLNLSRNLGLITGASAMGAVFTLASGIVDFATTDGPSVVSGTRAAFGVASALVVAALIVAIVGGRRTRDH